MKTQLSNAPSSGGDTVWENSIPWASLQVWKILSPADTPKILLQKGNTKVSFTPRAGWHIDSCKINGVEIFYPFFGDPNKPKGGMPYMYPNAGPLTQEQIDLSGLKLPQHGFGRISKWECNSETWEQRLVFSETPEFSFSGEVTLTVKIHDDGSLTFFQKVKNMWEKDLPLSTGLHPYFRIPLGNKDDITWDFDGGEQVFAEREIWKTGGTGQYDVPENKKIAFSIPKIGTIELELSEDYKKFWVWSMKDKDFICVEPVMNHEGGIATSPIFVPPWETNMNFMKISLKK